MRKLGGSGQRMNTSDWQDEGLHQEMARKEIRCQVLKLAAYSLLRSTLFRINVGAVDMLEHLDI